MASRPRVFVDFTVSEQPLGRVVFELYNDLVPKTCENFEALCTGEKGISPISHIPLHFKSSIVHRVIPGFMIQAGDFTKRTGQGGESIYGGIFPDERLEGAGCEVDKAGLLVMANRGPNTNGSQWFVTLAPAEHLTGKHVVFGKVIHGFEHIQAIGDLPTDSKDRPLSPVVISHCGELELRKAAGRPKPVSDAGSISPPRKGRRRSVDSDESDEERSRRRKERKEKKEKKRKPREETEEELDARLEREEKARLDIKRLEKLSELKKELEEERERVQSTGGVVFKGRGKMRYLDPESFSSHQKPTNYNSRLPDARPRPQIPRGLHRPDQSQTQTQTQSRSDGKWERGAEARPNFDKSRMDRDLDRYNIKRGEKGARRDYDDWRGGRDGRATDRDKETGGGRKSTSPQKRRSRSPTPTPPPREKSPVIRAESPLRGDRSDGSDMALDEDD